ncbi:MAG: LCP family protein [Patescibacteria group bacterium]|jgi:LCP family protein required for cell wall assembly
MSDPIRVNFINDPIIQEKPAITVKQQKSPDPETAGPAVSAPRRRHFSFKKLIISLTIAIIIVFIVFSSSIAFSNENLIKNLSQFNWLSQVGSLITSADRELKGEGEDRINFVIMGIGGGDHEGAELADTIILASYKPSTKQIALMSIPRDLYVKSPGYGWVKINGIRAIADKKKAGSGDEAMRQTLSDLLDIDIQYYATVDFDGFEKLIDDFGGVDVDVERDLIDYSYPIRGREDSYPIESRYEKLIIKKGQQHMDGALALKYARSRHALGTEGSDFARSKRQQKILLALKDKILAPGTFFNPQKINGLLEMYNENVHTNLQVWEIMRLLQFGRDIDFNQGIITYSLVDGTEQFLYDQMVSGAYVLLPYGGNYDKIKFIWQNIYLPEIGKDLLIDKTKWAEFKDATSTKATTTSSTAATIKTNNTTDDSATKPIAAPTETAKLYPNDPTTQGESTYQKEQARIEILNGTMITGWAGQEAGKLKAKGFNVINSGNAATKGYASIKIYDLSGGRYQLTTSELQIIYGVEAIAPPAGLKSSADIVIILGK